MLPKFPEAGSNNLTKEAVKMLPRDSFISVWVQIVSQIIKNTNNHRSEIARHEAPAFNQQGLDTK